MTTRSLEIQGFANLIIGDASMHSTFWNGSFTTFDVLQRIFVLALFIRQSLEFILNELEFSMI